VYDLGDGTVLRRCLDPEIDVTGEAAVMAHAHRHGVPTPRVLEASGPDLVMERVTGPTMLSALSSQPERAAECGRLLAELHHLLDTVPALQRGPAHHRLLHLDLHPGNVLLSGSGPALVDWTNAASGPRPLDVATTWVILRWMGTTDPAASALDDVRAELLAAFLAEVDRPAAEAALPAAAAARLADPATSAAERRRLSTGIGQVSRRRT
jgi:aminoglycoside phosphotransferase (APT) family kinase protein